MHSSPALRCLSNKSWSGRLTVDHQPCTETLDKHQADFQWVISLYHNTEESIGGLMGRKYETRQAWVKMTHSNLYWTQQGTGNRSQRVNCAHLKCIYKSCWRTHFHDSVCYTTLCWYKRPPARLSLTCQSMQPYVAVCLTTSVKLQLKLGVLQLRQSRAGAGMSVADGFLRSKTSPTQIAGGSRLLWHRRWKHFSAALRSGFLCGLMLTPINCNWEPAMSYCEPATLPPPRTA